MRNIVVKSAFIGTLLALGSQLSQSVQAQTNSVPVNGYSDIILFDKPAAYFRFEETSGAVATNSVPASLDGAYYTGDEAAAGEGGTPSNAKGDAGPRPPDFKGFDASNRSATFGGSATQDWVDAKKQYLQNLGAFSLEYWVRPTIRVSDPTTFGTRIGLVGQNDAIEYGFIDANTIQIWTPGGGSLNTAYSFPDGEWHHVATIADGTNLKNYYDGKLVGTSGSSTANYGSSTYFVHIGGGGVFDVTGNYFTGNIDEVAIFDRAISASRIAEHYKAGKEGGSFTVPFINDPSGNVNGFTIGVTDVGQHVADTNSIVLKYDGAPVTPTSVTKTNGVTTIAYNAPNAPLVSASTHTTSLSIKDTTGTSYSADGTFVVPTYGTILPSFAVTGVDTTKPGFKVKPYQVAAGQPNTMAWTEEMFVGLHGPNIADLTQTIDGTPIDANGYYTVTNVVNWDKDGSADGNFRDATGYPDTVMPGQPAGDGSGSYANDGEEVLTYVQFPTGGVFYTMGVNSDDGFKVTTGTNPKDAFQSVTLGIFDAGRGASDSIFKFYVPTAGIYPVRLLWENGGSGANCEWFTVQPDGTKILLNDPSSTNTTGIKAFYSGPATVPPAYVLSFTPTLVGGKLSIVDAGTQVTDGSVKLFLNGAAVPTTGGKSNGVTAVNYSLNAPFPSGSKVALSLVYQDNKSATITNSTTFPAGTFTAITKDSIAGRSGFIRGGTGGYTADAGGRTGKAGDYAIDSTPAGGTWVDIEDVSFLNAAATNDTLSMAMWIKKYDIVQGSAFWAHLSQVADGTDLRGFQAHTPWSDDTIYFDTAGCCDTSLQRISANINTFADYNTVGSDAYWTNWHHFVFTKKADQKNVYIDGNLFLNGSSTASLQPYFVGLGLFTDGLPGGDFMHGLIDDFAVYSTEVSAADAAKLAGGAAPSTVTSLIAWWDFNDATSLPPPSGPTITASRSGNTITIQWSPAGGTLESTSALGPTAAWTTVGTANPATVTIGTSNSFYRVRK